MHDRVDDRLFGSEMDREDVRRRPAMDAELLEKVLP
jgi:hypothetical protein